MTPMLDVTFIMLIFFIVTTSFAKELGMDVNRPSNAPTQVKRQSEVIAIQIAANGTITVGERPIDVRAVRANVERARAEKPDATVIVVIDRSADTGILVQVMDQAREAGAYNISVATAAT
jgi:biopolymer transport protein ExbD